MGNKEQQFILFGAGWTGIKTMHKLGKNNVYAFADNYKAGVIVEEKKVIDVATLEKEFYGGGYKIIICVVSPAIACEIASQLEERGIVCEVCDECKKDPDWHLMHIEGEKVIELSDSECAHERKRKWYFLYQQMLEKYRIEFKNKKIDFWIYLSDNPERAYWAVKLGVIDNSKIFAFVTTDKMQNIVIPVPDYMYYELPDGVKYDACIMEYKKRSKLPWSYEKAFWIGNLENHDSREKLFLLGKMYPAQLEIKAFDWEHMENFVSMTDLYQYKYLIDARGCGAWSDRLRILFLLRRVVFVNERSQKQFWELFGLEEGKHYISVKEDFSDLIKKMREIEVAPRIYESIVRELCLYAEKFLTKDFALNYLKNIILKYAVKERIID